MDYVTKEATVGRYRLRYVDEGSGPAVVLVHGLAGDLTAWDAQIELLRPHFRPRARLRLECAWSV